MLLLLLLQVVPVFNFRRVDLLMRKWDARVVGVAQGRTRWGAGGGAPCRQHCSTRVPCLLAAGYGRNTLSLQAVGQRGHSQFVRASQHVLLRCPTQGQLEAAEWRYQRTGVRPLRKTKCCRGVQVRREEGGSRLLGFEGGGAHCCRLLALFVSHTTTVDCPFGCCALCCAVAVSSPSLLTKG